MNETTKEELKELLTTAGSTFRGETSCTCPLHRDRNPSAGIYQAESGVWRFKCLVCGDNMDSIGLEARITGKRPEDIIKAKCGRMEIVPTVAYTEEQIRGMFAVDKGYRYLHEYADKGIASHFVAVKYEGEHKKFIQMSRYGFNFVLKNNSSLNPLFRLDDIRNAETVVIVEGEKCVLALEYIGINYATTSMGGAKNAKKTDFTPLRGKRVIIIQDNDKAGTEYRDDVIAILTPLDCIIGVIDPIELMLGEKEDIADYIKKHIGGYTKDELKTDIEQTINEAKTTGYYDTFVRGHVADLRSGVLKSIDVGWDNLQQSKWLQGATVTTLCAKPGVGKTWFVHNLTLRCIERGVKVANIQLEDSKDYHIARMLMAMAGIQNDPDKVTEDDLRRMDSHRKFIDDIAKCLIVPDGDKNNLIDMADLIKQKAAEGCKIIILDSVSVAEKSAKTSWADDQIFVNKVKMIVKIYKCRVILVTHPKTTASSVNRDGKQIQTMSLDTISGGTAYQRLSQTILWLYDVPEGTESMGFDQKGNRAIAILKARNKSESTPSNKISFALEKSRFYDLGYIS